MENKNIRLFIVTIMALTLLLPACSISITRNYYSEKPETPIKTDSTTYVVKLGSHLPIPKDEQQ